jgi:hypothetical protein
VPHEFFKVPWTKRDYIPAPCFFLVQRCISDNEIDARVTGIYTHTVKSKYIDGEDLKFDLELAQITIRDRTMAKDQALRLAAEFKRVSDILGTIPDEADAVMKTIGEHFHLFHEGTAIRVLKYKMTAFDEASFKFHQRVIRLRNIVQSESPLLLDSQGFALVGKNPKFAQVAETSYTAKASYVKPRKTGRVDGEVLVEKTSYVTETKGPIFKSAGILARKLGPALAAWKIPHLIGYRDDAGEKTVQLVFERPDPGKELTDLSQLPHQRHSRANTEPPGAPLQPTRRPSSAQAGLGAQAHPSQQPPRPVQERPPQAN